MQDLKKDLRLALVQLEPVLFDKAACLGNTLKKLAEVLRIPKPVILQKTVQNSLYSPNCPFPAIPLV